MPTPSNPTTPPTRSGRYARSALRRRRRLALVAAPLLALAVAGTAIGAGVGSSPRSGAAAGAAVPSAPVTIRLGYLPNLTDATAIVGVHDHAFADHLPPGDTLQPSTFNAGPAEVTALLSGALDAAYLGPSSAVTAFVQSGGKGVRIVSGATVGGAALVVAPSITAPSQLEGRTIATPQLGNTQDVALRTWLTAQHLTFPGPDGGRGRVTILPEDNATTLASFKAGMIAGAWVPEPWVARLIGEAGGRVLVDERSLWPDGRFSTTVLVVNGAFLSGHPDLVTDLLRGQVATDTFLTTSPARARSDAAAALTSLTGRPLRATELAAAWSDLSFTDDPVASSIATDVRHARSVGFPSGPIAGLYDLQPLNAILAASGASPVAPS